MTKYLTDLTSVVPNYANIVPLPKVKTPRTVNWIMVSKRDETKHVKVFYYYYYYYIKIRSDGFIEMITNSLSLWVPCAGRIMVENCIIVFS